MSTPRPILRLGTRASLLARTQSQLVANLLAPHFPGTIQLTLITTTGDKVSSASEFASPPDAASIPNTPDPTPQTPNKSDFTKELEEALLANTIDFAVHSAKDLPTQLPAGLTIASTPTREIPNDMWIGHNGLTIEQLPPGAIVGTSSLRRQAQLLARRPDLKTIPLRGNIDTRLKKVALGTTTLPSSPDARSPMPDTPLHGTFLAAAGLRRANLVPPTAILLPTDQFIPAPGQGTLALECRSDDTLVRDLLTKIHDPITAASLACERRIVRTFAGNCLSPLGVCAEPRATVNAQPQTGWIVRAIIATPDGKDSARATLLTEDPTPTGLAALTPKLIETLESRGGRAILSSHR